MNKKTKTVDNKEKRKKRKLGYVEDQKRRFIVERDRFMLTNELTKITQFEDMFRFERRYLNGLTGKTDRAIPSWVYSHIDAMNKLLIKESEKEYYPFNTQYVITGDIEPESTVIERKKRIAAERELLIMQGKYEEATKKAQVNS